MIGFTAVDALKKLVREDLNLSPDFYLEIVSHEAAVNWRQRHTTARQRIAALDESLLHGPIDSFLVRVGDDSEIARLFSRSERSGRALSVASRILDQDQRRYGHLALMNLHPDGFLSRQELESAVHRVAHRTPGYLLNSGRFFHYYGARVLTHEQWIEFLARFLMPCTMVSPRYIGHSLSRGFCCLRLNSVAPHKPYVPKVISLIGGPPPAELQGKPPMRCTAEGLR